LAQAAVCNGLLIIVGGALARLCNAGWLETWTVESQTKRRQWMHLELFIWSPHVSLFQSLQSSGFVNQWKRCQLCHGSKNELRSESTTNNKLTPLLRHGEVGIRLLWESHVIGNCVNRPPLFQMVSSFFRRSLQSGVTLGIGARQFNCHCQWRMSLIMSWLWSMVSKPVTAKVMCCCFAFWCVFLPCQWCHSARILDNNGSWMQLAIAVCFFTSSHSCIWNKSHCVILQVPADMWVERRKNQSWHSCSIGADKSAVREPNAFVLWHFLINSSWQMSNLHALILCDWAHCECGHHGGRQE